MADLVIYNDGELELNVPINNVFSDDELDKPSVIANFATTEADGKRNINRFPEKFRFQLTEQEKHELVANCDQFNTLKHSTSLPFAFTEQGVSMLSAVLKSDTAIKMSIQIIKTFVGMRKFAEAWSDKEIMQRTVALIPWRSNITLLDRDLAELYAVKAIRLREQIRRNIKRFPDDFMFQLNESEADLKVSQNAIPSNHHSRDACYG